MPVFGKTIIKLESHDHRILLMDVNAPSCQLLSHDYGGAAIELSNLGHSYPLGRSVVTSDGFKGQIIRQ